MMSELSDSSIELSDDEFAYTLPDQPVVVMKEEGVLSSYSEVRI